MTDFLLRQQIEDFRAGRKVGNQVPARALSRRERDMLISHLAAIDAFRDRLRNELTGDF